MHPIANFPRNLIQTKVLLNLVCFSLVPRSLEEIPNFVQFMIYIEQLVHVCFEFWDFVLFLLFARAIEGFQFVNSHRILSPQKYK